jgi:uncharacterized RDD family membrane protein YckC
MKFEQQPLASFSLRAAALSIDLMCVCILQIMMGGMLISMYEIFCYLLSTNSQHFMQTWLSQFSGIFIFIGYFTLSVGIFGNSLGKRATNIQTLHDTTHQPLTLWQAFQRSLAYLLSSWTYLIGFFIAYFRHDQKALHDLVCGTYVIDRAALHKQATLIKPIGYDTTDSVLETFKRAG